LCERKMSNSADAMTQLQHKENTVTQIEVAQFLTD
jgi:hypothetical protein